MSIFKETKNHDNEQVNYGTFLEEEYKEPEEEKAENFAVAKKHFIARLSKLLVDRDVKKQDLADAICVSPSSVSGYLAGNHHPDMATLLAISNFFDVSLDYLFGKTEYSFIYNGKLSAVENEMLGYYSKLQPNRQYEILGGVKELYRIDKKESE